MAEARSWRDGLVTLLGVIGEGGDRSGAWRFGEPDRRSGAVLVDHGRICWAIAPGTRRLTDVLAERHRIDRGALEAIYRRCQARGAPLGQSLVEDGVVSAEELRGTLLEQTAEAVVVLAPTEVAPSWVPHRGGGYAPQFTFSLAEIAARAAALGLGVDPSERAAALADRLRGGGWGAAFVGRSPPLPVAVVGEETDLGAVLAVGRWAERMISAWARTGKSAGLATARTGSGTAVAWLDVDGINAAVCDDATTISRLLARHARRTEE